MKLKDGYKKLIGTSYNGDISLVLLSNGGNLGYDISSTTNTLVLRNANGLIESSLATGTAPLKVASTTLVENLNADLLDDNNGTFYKNRYTYSVAKGKYLKIAAADTSHLIISGSMTLGLAALLCYYSVYGTGTAQRTRFRYIYYSSDYKVFVNNESGKRELYIYNNASSNLVASINISALNTNTPYCEVVDALPASYVEYDSSYALAKLSSNVASATKLQTARTIWGQSFDGTADISGDLSVGDGDIYLMNNRIIRAYPTSGSSIELLKLNASNIFVLGKGAAVNGYNTYLDGNNIHFRYGTSPTTGMILNSSGNVLIGTTTDSGAKLTVNGSALATSFVTSGGTASLFVKGDGSLDNKAYITATDIVNTATNGIFYIEGTGTTAGTWLGEHASISLYYKGLTIAYKIPIAGISSGTTLNINSLGAKAIKMNTSNLTTHFGVGVVVILVYNGTDFRVADYDSNTNTQIRIYRLNSGYNADYPLIVSRTVASSIGTSGTNSSYSGVYGVMWDDTTKVPTLNPSTGEIKAIVFTGTLNGNADSASKLTTVSKTAWGLTYWTSGGVPTSISGDMTGVGNIEIPSSNSDRFITFNTGSTHNWRIGYIGSGSGNANYLSFQSTKSNSAADGWHDALKFECETLNATFTGQVIASNFVSGEGINDFSAGTVKFDTLNIPTSSGGTTFGPGSSGLVLKSNGTTVYWASDSNSNTWRNIKVNGTQIAGTGTSTYSVDYLSGDGINITGVAGTSTTKNNTITITNTGVRSVTIGTDDNANKVAVNTGGTTTYLTIPYATHSTHLMGGALGSIPYQSAADTTTFLAAPTTNGYVLKYNTTDKKPYWAADSDTKVTQTITTTNANYRVLFSATADDTTRTETARKAANLLFNPSSGLLTAGGFVKSGYDDTYVLLAGGGHKALSELGGASGDYVLKTGDTMTGNLILYASSGDSPHLIFQRATTTDNKLDWDQYVTGGSFKIRVNSSGTWTEALSLYPNSISTTWNITANDFTASSGIYRSDTTLYLDSASTTTSIIFRHGTTECMRIALPNGNVGIGIDAPTLKLHVNGNTIATNFGVNSKGGGNGISLYNGSGNVATYGIAFNQTSDWGTHGAVTGDWATYFTVSKNGTNQRGWIFRSDSSNVASIGTGGEITASSYRSNSYSLLGYCTNAGDWTGGTAGSYIVGSNIEGIIRTSGDNLYHYNWTTGTRYKIWDSYNSDRIRMSNITCTSAGWYRIASTPVDVNNNNCTFYITAIASGNHTNVILNASISFNNTANDPCLLLLGCVSYSACLTKARIVWNRNVYAGLYAHLEIYKTSTNQTTIYTRCVGYGWNTLITTATTGTIPSNYTSKEISLSNGNFVGNLLGNASTASKLATARTISLTGSVTGSGSFDGSGNLSIATTTNHTHDGRYYRNYVGGISSSTVDTFDSGRVCGGYSISYSGYSGMLLSFKSGLGSVSSIEIMTPHYDFYSGGGLRARLAVDNNRYTAWRTFVFTDSTTFIKRSGDTLSSSTARISRAGSSVSWYQGRTNAMVYISSYTGYNAIASMKTTDGDWSIGVYTDNKMYFTYFTDTNANNAVNSHSGQVYLAPGGYVYAAHFYEHSDIKLKTNIETITSSDNIPQLKSFDWKSDGKHSYGLIAQELEEQGYSELVDNSGEHKTVNYSAALSLIVGKLQVKIKELEKEIETLKNKN